jgi:hypothetical protein
MSTRYRPSSPTALRKPNLGIVHDKFRRDHHLFRWLVLRVQIPATLLALFSDEASLYPHAEKCPLKGNRRSALWANNPLEHNRYNEDERQEWDSEPSGQVQGRQANRHALTRAKAPTRQSIRCRSDHRMIGFTITSNCALWHRARRRGRLQANTDAGGRRGSDRRCEY